MAQKPSRPSRRSAAPKGTAEATNGFPTCEQCPHPADCDFEEVCADRGRNGGRPTLFSEALATEIIEWLEDGKTLLRWCEQPGKPDRRTVHRWARARPGFASSLAQARENATHAMVEDTVDIADDGQNDTYRDEDGNERVDTDAIQRSKLRVETRLKVAAMLNPLRYGPKLDVTSAGQALGTLPEDQIDARLKAMFALAASLPDAAATGG